VEIAKRLVTCDGEWFVLYTLAKAAWRHVHQTRTPSTGDWLVEKSEDHVPIEVKAKHAIGSAVGRLTLALSGLMLLPRFAFLNDYTWDWYAEDDLDDETVREFLNLFIDGRQTIEAFITNSPSVFDIVPIGATNRATLSFQTTERGFAIDVSGTRKSLSLIAEPNRFPGYALSGGGAARFGQSLEEILTGLEVPLARLGLQKQAVKRPADTLFVVVWEVPWHLLENFDASVVGEFWERQCSRLNIRRGALQPVQRMRTAPPTVFNKAAERELDLAAIAG